MFRGVKRRKGRIRPMGVQLRVAFPHTKEGTIFQATWFIASRAASEA
jgi:hypothetical protein